MDKLGRRLMGRTRLRSGNLATDSDGSTLHTDVDPVTAETGVTGDTGDSGGIQLDVSLTI